MNRIRPIAGALLATLMLIPAVGFVPTAAQAAEVELLPPGGGLDPPTESKPETDTGIALPDSQPARVSRSSSSDPEVDARPTLQTRHFGLQVELSCAVAGTPHAIVVINRSAEDLPAGTRIKWTLKSEGKRGFFALLGPLAGGETLIADNVLEGGVDTSAGCVARVI